MAREATEAGPMTDADARGPEQADQGTEATRTAILDAVVRCFAAQGWAGTNMSLVARETGMTRGKIQYYFPVLEDLKLAAMEYLYASVRQSYFTGIRPDAATRERFDDGIDLLWQLARDPLHVAMAELEASARTDEVLRRALAEIHVVDEELLNSETRAAFPAFAAVGEHELKLGRLFVTIFINGLAAQNFPEEAGIWQAHLIAMLKECLSEFWARRGISGLSDDADSTSADPKVVRATREIEGIDARRREAIGLLREALAVLNGEPAPAR